MTDEAATPTGGAEGEQHATPVERIKTFLNPPSPVKKPTQETAKADTGEPVPSEPAEGDGDSEAPEKAPTKTTTDEETDDDAPEAEAALPSSLDELATALEWDLDRVLDLEAKTKIDGKEGKVRIRDLVKSHQLEGHLNQKLMQLSEDRREHDTKVQKIEREYGDKFLKLDAGLKTLERALMGEFSQVDWQKLQTEDPIEFNSKFVSYQHRYAQLQDIAQAIAGERQTAQNEMATKAKAYLDEQKKLLAAKVPEWGDEDRRNKDKAEIVTYLKDHGITKQEFEQIVDHRLALVFRDAWQWGKLQKAKPATLKQVKSAPKLLKPGTPQSQASQAALALKADRERLRKTGSGHDAVKVFKHLGIA